jgi:hypothetical protein
VYHTRDVGLSLGDGTGWRAPTYTPVALHTAHGGGWRRANLGDEARLDADWAEVQARATIIAHVVQ